MKKNYRIAPEVKEQILKRIKEEGVSVIEAAKEHGLNPTTIYSWLSRGIKDIPTLGELARIKRQNNELLNLVGELTLKMNQTKKKS